MTTGELMKIDYLNSKTICSSAWHPLFIVAGYLWLIKKALPAHMASRKPYNLNTAIRIYNLLQVAMNGYICYLYVRLMNDLFLVAEEGTTGVLPACLPPCDYGTQHLAVHFLLWRGNQYISGNIEFIHPHFDVHLLFPVKSRSQFAKVPLVEALYYFVSNYAVSGVALRFW
uniref:Very-long-chain 3-oxoacyl-CoA synthase n=1 Tax=Rhodnius prolixus TaxID=13249 RepID=T1H9B2_RHOPR